MEKVAQRRIRLTFGTHRNMAVVVTFTRRQRTAARGRVGREGIQRIVLLQAHILHLQRRKALVGIKRCHDLRKAHAVADQVDHVSDFSLAAVVSIGRRVNVDTLGELQFIVLKSPEIARGLVQTLRTGHATDGRTALADLEILVAEIVEESGADLRTVGVDVVDPHVVERIIARRSFGSAPETHGLAPAVGAVDDLFQLHTFGGNDRTFAVPLRIVPEVYAYEGDALQLVRGIIGLPITVETDIGGIFAEILRRGNPSRDGDTHGFGIHGRIEDFGITAQQRRNGLQRRFGRRFEFDHQLQTFVRIFPCAAAVAPKKRHDRLDVERLESHVGRKVLDIVPHQQPAVVQEHVGFDRVDPLRISLPEGSAAAIVVVRMDQHGAFGRSRYAEAQCRSQQPAFQYLFHRRSHLAILTTAITGAWSET